MHTEHAINASDVPRPTGPGSPTPTGADPDSVPVLWQLQLSHYVEKVRWALDYKRVPTSAARCSRGCTAVKAKRLTGDTSTRRCSPSTGARSATRLESSPRSRSAGRSRRCIPRIEAQRRRALELEEFFDEELGPHIRRAFYHELLPHRSCWCRCSPTAGRARRGPCSGPDSPACVWPCGEIGHQRRVGRASRAKMVAAMDRLEREISTSGYLVGDSFTVADLTAAALFYAVARPPEFPYPMVADDDLPDSWREFLDSLAQRPGGQWVAEIYRRHRGQSAELTPGSGYGKRRRLSCVRPRPGQPRLWASPTRCSSLAVPRSVGRWMVLAGLLASVASGVSLASAPTCLAGRVSARGAQSSAPRGAARALVDAGAPGAIVLLTDGRRTRVAANGWASVQRRAPMRVDDRFHVGSVTKMFIATVVLQLVAEHRLRLSDTVEQWLPGQVPAGDVITLRELLEHRSGLANYTSSPDFFPPIFAGTIPPAHRWSPAELLALANAQPPAFAPGTQYGYSNTNYVVLGLIVEAATHQRIQTVLRRRILEPLHLRATYLPTATGIRGPHADGYLGFPSPAFPPAGANRADATGLSPTGAWTAGGLVSTAADLGRFLHALLSGELLPRPQLAAMKQLRPAPPLDGYGLGLAGVPSPCGRQLGHDGEYPGYDTHAWGSPDGRHIEIAAWNLYPSTSAPTDRAFGAVVRHTLCAAA